MRVIIEIDTRQKAAKTFLEFMKSLPFIRIISESKEDKTLAEFRKAIREVKNAKKNNKNLIDAKTLIDEL